MLEFEKVDDGVHVFKGAANTGILISNGKVLLIDCCDTLPDVLQPFAGTNKVDMVLFTQHRRPNTGGVYRWSGSDVKIIVPDSERHLFDKVEQYWSDPANRMHLYHHQPSDQILPCSIDVSATVRDGDVIAWEEFSISVLDTPGATDGSVSYIVAKGDRSWCFCGDLIYGDDDDGNQDVIDAGGNARDEEAIDGDTVDGDKVDHDVISKKGKLWNMYSLQKGEGCLDYHGYMGNWRYLCASLEKILAQKPDMLIPSHGGMVRNPMESASLLIRKLFALYGNYASISSMNHYFPGFFDGKADLDGRMKPAATFDFPEFIRPVGFTSSLVLSETGDGLLVDCGNDSVIDNLNSLREAGVLKSLDACWVTHYHDDHADALDKLEKAFHCNIQITSVMKDVLENPERYHLPCLSPVSIKAKGLEHGHQWRWKEFNLTALHFPGQTFYHGGLLVEKQGVKVLFGGDSFSPAGIDDYCSGNRNFSGKERGFRYCIDLIRDIRPDFIINQHQDKAFSFSDEELDYMDRTLAERERLLSVLMPWDSPDFGTDESWVCAYPYWQTASPGSEITMEVRFTNHGDRWIEASAAPILPDGWNLAGGTEKESCTGVESGAAAESGTGYESVMIPSRKAGPSPAFSDHDGSIILKVAIPDDAPRNTVAIPLRICWDGKYLGQFRHALVQIV